MTGVRVWLGRLGLALAAWLVVWVFAVLMGAEVSPVLLALAVLGAAGALCFVLDVLPSALPADWSPGYLGGEGMNGSDAQLVRLEHRIAHSKDHSAVATQIQGLLAAATDDRLRSRYGIDRSVDPEGARRVLGERLDDYLSRPPPRNRGSSSDFLSPLIERIESL